MRIGGLASGMDTEQIIRDLMRVQRMPIDKLNQNKQTIEWQRDAYREVNTMMSTLRDNIFDTVMRSANMSSKRVASSNSALVTATATAAAARGSYTISNVERLAKAATVVGTDKVGLDSTKPLKDQTGEFEWKQGKVVSENKIANGTDKTFTLADEVITDNGDPQITVKVGGKLYEVVTDKAVEDLTENQVLLDGKNLTFKEPVQRSAQVAITYVKESTEDVYTSASIKTATATGEVNETFFIAGDRTLNQVMTQINGSKAGVSMMYDSFADKVTMMRKETGKFSEDGQEVKLEGAFFSELLKLDDNVDQGAQNAKFTINGLNTERPTNTFSMNGVTFTLRDTFTTGEATLSITTDTDKIFDTIKGFVDEYNGLLEKINGKLTEERYRDYKPLTDEQREALSEKDIERWEEKAMSGLLRRDQLLSAGIDRFRYDIYSPVSMLSDSPIRQLTDIGITTSRDYMQRGRLEIDESKLREAIERDPEGVFQLFNADGPTNAEKGIARRMREGLHDTMRSIAERAGGSLGKLQNHQFTLGRNLNEIDSRISNFERRLQQVEDRYWRQFTAMETAMQQANSQAESLFAQLYGGQ